MMRSVIANHRPWGDDRAVAVQAVIANHRCGSDDRIVARAWPVHLSQAARSSAMVMMVVVPVDAVDVSLAQMRAAAVDAAAVPLAAEIIATVAGTAAAAVSPAISVG